MSRDLCTRYLDALEASDLDGLLSLFTDAAVVTSPLYGEASPRDFFGALLTDSESARMQLVDVYQGSDPGRLALHLRTRWTLAGGFVSELDAVDLFELDASGERFSRLTIVYDTAPVRETFAGLKSAWGGGSPIEQSARARTIQMLLDDTAA